MKIQTPIIGLFGVLATCVAYAVDQTVIKDEFLNSPGDIVAALKEASVIPDVLPKKFSPKLAISLIYTEAHESVKFGNIINPKNTTTPPVLQIYPLIATPTIDTNKTYTLVLSDPDATSHAKPVKGQMCHWIATGIDISKGFSAHRVQELELRHLSPLDDDAMDASELVKYLPPSPPPKTGFHRYVFVLLESETAKDNERKLKEPKDRPRWGYKKKGKGVMKWAKKNHLVPVAANYFLAQNEKQ